MKTFLLITAVAALLSCNSAKQNTMNSTDAHNSASEEGFTALFDGKTTAGWHAYNRTGVGKAWKVEDGALHFDPEVKKDAKGEGGDIVTDNEYENFHFKYEWKISPRGNSGVFFFVKEESGRDIWHTGPEMQVLDNGTPTTAGHPDARLYSHRAGDLYDLLASKEAALPAGEWNRAEIIANKGKLDFYLNGQHTLSTTMWDENWNRMIAISKFKDKPDFGKMKKGRIGLQDHGDHVWFRNLRIKQL